MPQFTKEELHLLKLCFDINAGDFYARRSLFPEWLKEDLNLTIRDTEKNYLKV